MNRETEINPSAKYRPRDAHKLLGLSLRYLYDLCNKGELDYELNRRTGYKMYKGSELIKFRNNNPL